MIPKTNNLKSRKLRDSARGQSCVKCGANDGTVVLAHYTGLRQHYYGKGRGVKGHDAIGAHLCSRCHTEFDNVKQRKSIEASEDFLHCVALTVVRLFDEGVIKT